MIKHVRLKRPNLLLAMAKSFTGHKTPGSVTLMSD